jgi:hypothetical protein
MGELIVFQAEKDGTHLKPSPEGSAKIVFFTGVWHEPMNDRAGKRDAHRVWEKQALSRLKLGNGLSSDVPVGLWPDLSPVTGQKRPPIQGGRFPFFRSLRAPLTLHIPCDKYEQ